MMKQTPTRSIVRRLSCVALLAAIGVNSQFSTAAPNDPLSEVAGKWRVTIFLIGGEHQFDSFQCGMATVRPPSDRAVSASIKCAGAGRFSFRIEYDPETKAYAVTVNSKVGISVENFPVTYLKKQGWRGQGAKLIDGKTVPVTAEVVRIEGRRWNGWRIQVVPTEESDAAAHPYFFVDLTRAK